MSKNTVDVLQNETLNIILTRIEQLEAEVRELKEEKAKQGEVFLKKVAEELSKKGRQGI